MKARELFAKIGYELIRSDNDYVIYSKKLKERNNHNT